MKYMGDYVDNALVRIFFTTNDGSGGAIAPSTAFEAADVVIYKNGSATQKVTTNGITMTSPFDGVTGLHLLEIDTNNDTGDAGFWVSGNDYSVVLSPDETVDGQIVVHPLAQFSIENRSALRPTTAGNTLDVTAAGNAGINWGNVENPTTSVTLSSTTIGTTTNNTDMRGTDSAFLAASAPTNFGSLVITAGGAVDSLVQGYLNTLILESTAGRIAANFDNFYDNGDSLTTRIVDNVHPATEVVSGGAINTTSGAVDTVTTNTDMRGTDSALLAASAPTNFGSLVITAGGAVDSLVQGFFNTLIVETSAGRIAANFDNFYDNADAATTKVVGDVGGEDIYHAEINLTIDTNNTRDEYTVTWLKNGVRITSGITVPTIQVIKRTDGTDLIPSTAMLEIGSTGSYKHDEPTNRIVGGDAVLVVVNATIDSGARSFIRLRSRDS